jgi:hypothetical protein
MKGATPKDDKNDEPSKKHTWILISGGTIPLFPPLS